VGNHSLPTSGDQITPVAATRKRQTALNDSSRVSPGGVLCNTINNVNRSIPASNSWPSSGNPVTPLAAATLALQTPVVGHVTQCSKKASTTGVTTTIPGTQTRNSTYKVGESSRRPKRSKRLPLQSDTPVRFNLDDADGNVRKVYDKHVGISEESYDQGDPTFECKECHALSSAPLKSKHPIDRDIIRQVKDVLNTLSDLVKTFRRVRGRYSKYSEQNIRIKLVAKRGTDGRTYNLPTANEVASLIVGDFDTCVEQKDIVIEKLRKGLERINIFHPLYLPLQYPLLMSRGQDRYHLEIPHRKKPGQHVMGKKDKMFLVDGYTMVETERLYFHRAKQSKLRCDTYSNIRQSVAKGNTDPTLLGKPVVLSFSFTGGPRYMETHNLSSTDRPDVMSRVFKMKLDQLMKDLKVLHLFGHTQVVVYTVEFQKRGLPHAHIYLFLHKDDKVPSVDQIKKFISAEIPDKNEDLNLYKLVSDFMMHGPCGEDDATQVCMADEKCTKHFPKKITERSSVDSEGYPVYRRRDNERYMEKSKSQLHNGYVIPYNATLLKRYQCHINVELCSQTGSIKYLFKYINKGPDRVSAQLYETVTNEDGQQVKKVVDEIKAFYDCRYLSACEAAWRIFGFETHYRTPFVESMFKGWMKMNELYPKARELTYAEFLTNVSISTGDAYYCRMLLNIAKGCRTHDEIKKVNGVVYPTYKEACYASGLLEDDNEYVDSIKDVAHWAPPEHLRELFVTLLSQKELTTPLTVWLQTWHLLAQDVQYKRRQVLNIPDLIISDDEKKNVCLFYMEELLRSRGCSLRNWPKMPYPDSRYITKFDNRLIYDETDYNHVKLQIEYERLKTFLWETLAASIRRRVDIVLNVESSGIASLLMSGGRTAHSRFHISINIDETSTCSISAQSDLGALLKKCKLIIWDEAPMANKHCFKALDRSLRDILRKSRYDTCDQPFGNMTMVFEGDFRQVLSVIPKGPRQDIVSVSLKQSYLWDHCKVLKDGELREENDGEVEMDVPEEILIDQGDDPVASIVDFTYPNILDNIHDPSYFKEKVVLAPTNEVVDNINEHLLDKFPGEEMVYLSCDSVDKTERNTAIDKAILTGIYQWIEVLWCTQP
ncbi:hypothetical protein Tco_1303885, partial [Tanacetum coccineum]